MSYRSNAGKKSPAITTTRKPSTHPNRRSAARLTCLLSSSKRAPSSAGSPRTGAFRCHVRESIAAAVIRWTSWPESAGCRRRSQEDSWRSDSTTTSAGRSRMTRVFGETTTTSPVTPTGLPVAAESNLAARWASNSALGMWRVRWPATMRVRPATHTGWPVWFFVLSVKTPPGPITTWSMSEVPTPTGTACSTVHSGPNELRILPTTISPSAPWNQGRVSALRGSAPKIRPSSEAGASRCRCDKSSWIAACPGMWSPND